MSVYYLEIVQFIKARGFVAIEAETAAKAQEVIFNDIDWHQLKFNNPSIMRSINKITQDEQEDLVVIPITAIIIEGKYE